MASEELDVAIYGDFPILVTKSNGIDTTVVASVNSELQYGILSVSDDIKEPKDLEGKRVVVPVGTVTQYFWEQYVKSNGLDINKIEVINSLDAASLLSAGEADASVNTSYGIGSLHAKGLGTIFDTGANIEEGYSTQLVTVKTDYLKENPDVAVALNKALLRAYEDVTKNPQVLYDAEDSPNISADVWKEVYSYDTSFEYLSPEITDSTVTYFEHLNDWLYENSITTNKIDVNSLYDTSYYEQAVEELKK